MYLQDVRRIKRDMLRFENSWFKLKGAKLNVRNRDSYLDLINSWPEMYVEMGEKYLMAKVKPATTNNGKVEFKGFVNYVLDEDDKSRFKTWDIDDHDLWLLLSGDIQAGYKLTTSYNPQNDTYNATYMCNDTTSPNVGYCLSSFAPDWYTAVKSLVFKHNEILGCIWGQDLVKEKLNWG